MDTPNPPQVTSLGTGSWGTTLALLAAGAGARVTLLARDAAEAAQLRADGENRRFLPGYHSPGLIVTHDIAAGLWAAPPLPGRAHPTMRSNIATVAAHLPADPTDGPALVSCAKGLEVGPWPVCPRCSRPPCRPAGGIGWRRCPAPTSPARSRRANRPPASSPPPTRLSPRKCDGRSTARPSAVYTNADVVGIELAGALKNIIALGAGVIDGYGLGDDAKAAFITRGITEIARLGCAEGGQALTFAGLAGVGDVMVTGYSPHSRNHRLSLALAGGATLPDAQRALGGVAEAVPTTRAALALAAGHGSTCRSSSRPMPCSSTANRPSSP